MSHHTTDREDCEATDAVRTQEVSGDAKSKEVIARNEYNLERWSYFLFPHSKTTGLDDLRRLITERRETAAGCEIKYIEVTPRIGKKAFTNRTYTTLLALILLWYENQTADGSFRIHLSDIAKKKRIDHNAGNNLKRIWDDLYSLKTTAIDFASTFIDSDGLENSLKSVSILSALELEPKTDNPRDRYISGAFSEPIITNLKNEKTNPKNLSSILEIDTEIGQILYRYIDTKIYGNNVFEKASAALFYDLFGDAKRYDWLSRRKQVLEYHINQINGSVLSSGKLLSVFLSDTADKKDIKIVCTSSAKNLPNRKRVSVKVANTDKTTIDGLAAAIQEAVGTVNDPNWISWTKFLARSYSGVLIFRAIAEFNEAVRHGHEEIEHRGPFFTALFHRMVHKTDARWVGDCSVRCNKRPKNTTN